MSIDKKEEKKREKAERKREKKERKEKKRKRKTENDDEPESGSISSVDENVTKKPRLLAGLLEKANGRAEEDFNKNILLKGSKNLDEFTDTLDKSLIDNLISRKITSLFEIQVKTLPTILAGKDVIGRARTGMGKTLAFALPVIQQLLKANVSSRLPKVIVLAPTRELAKQVAKEFELTARQFKVLCVYGGSSINDQAYALRNGIDIVVGTPGRVIDHIDRGNLQLREIKHLILDEADQMLDMGFKEDMDRVFDYISEQNGNKKFQVLLFSATLPSWVHKVAQEKMVNPTTIDLVGDFESASKDVEHLCIQCHWDMTKRASMVSDLVKMYAGSQLGRAIVFCSKKVQCNDLAVDKKLAKLSKVIHGDITQAQRESTLQGFRNGMFKVLIATDVAARGLDIKNVDLVVNFEPPCVNSNKPNRYLNPRADVDTYVHRSGRTGRAGKKGVCVTLFSLKQEGVIKQIERTTSNPLTRIGAPQTNDLLLGAARSNIEDMLQIPDKVLAKFDDIVDEMVEFYGAKRSLTMCLAKITGFEEVKSVAQRSLLASEEGYVTVKYENRFKNPGDIRLGYIWTILHKTIDDRELVEKTKSMQLLKSDIGAVFDLPEEAANLLKKKIELGDRGAEGFEICQTLPEVKQRDFGRSNGSRGRGGGFRGRGRGGSRYGSNGRGRSRGGFSSYGRR